MVPKIVLLDGAFRPHYYRELRAQLQAEWLVPDEPQHVLCSGVRPDLVLLSDEYHNEVSVAASAMMRQGVPVLHIVDGVVEWRNTWENPRSRSADRGMPLFQPILSHKIACIGRSQARIFESWGNLGRCEVVGVTRFDQLLGRKPRVRAAGAPIEILVMTAKTAGFTPEQLSQAENSLRDLKNWFDAHSQIGETQLKPRWRISSELDQQIGVTSQLGDTTGQELAAVLSEVDAVISTPSTAVLEAMLQGVPTALLDYNNCPHYIPAAWTITAPRHFGQVLPELVNPPQEKQLYQDTLLHDALECRTAATPRLVRLAEEMIRIGRESRARGRSLQFPRRILHDPQDGHHLPEERFDLSQFYPEHLIFARMDRAALQAELGHLHFDLKRLQAKFERYQQRRVLMADVLEQYGLLRPIIQRMRRFRRMWAQGRSSHTTQQRASNRRCDRLAARSNSEL